MKNLLLCIGLLALSPSARAESDSENKLDAGHVVLDYNQAYEASEDEQDFKQQCLKDYPALIKEAKDCRQFECAGFTLARDLSKSEKTMTDSHKEDEKAWQSYRDNECWNSRISKERCLDEGGKVELPAGSASAKKSKQLPIRDVWCVDMGNRGSKSCIGSQFCVENWAR